MVLVDITLIGGLHHGSIVFFPSCDFEMGPEGVLGVHYSRGCYSDVGDARLCRELVKEE